MGKKDEFLVDSAMCFLKLFYLELDSNLDMTKLPSGSELV